MPATGTLVVAVAGRTAQTLPATEIALDAAGTQTMVGRIDGAIPAAPQERDTLAVTLPAGSYDAVVVGDEAVPLSVTVKQNQVEPLLLGFDAGRLAPGGAYAGNDQVNLGLGELAGRFVPMPAFNLVDQHGKPFTSASTAGSDVVVAAFHTTCHETCPLYTAMFEQLARHLPRGVVLAEVTTDPGTDTPQHLDQYARALGATWTFATGTADDLTTFWKPLGVELSSSDSHVSTLALVDAHGYVRLVYRGVPDVGHQIDPTLVGTLSAQGLHELASGGDGWGAPDVLQSLSSISTAEAEAKHPGGAASSFKLTDTAGHSVDSSSLRGEPLVINFWASYCPPCKAEMPMLSRDVAAHPGVRLVLIDEGDGADRARTFLASIGVADPSLLDSDLGVGRAYGAFSYPTTVFVKADGTIAARIDGQLDENVLLSQLNLMAG